LHYIELTCISLHSAALSSDNSAPSARISFIWIEEFCVFVINVFY